MYKDKAKQREKDRERQRRYRANRGLKAYQKDVTNSGRDKQGVTEQRVGIDSMIKPKPELTAQGNIRVSKPGDSDYEPQCKTTRAFVDNRAKRLSPLKQVKVFEDLPPDIQQTIDIMSVVDGKIDQTIKANRTAIAVHYQHLFPDRYNRTGVA